MVHTMWHRMMRMRKRAVHFPKLNRRSGSVTIFSRSMRRLDYCVRASMYSMFFFDTSSNRLMVSSCAFFCAAVTPFNAACCA